MRELDWDDLRFVLAVAREASLAGAARRLGVNESTVARRIAQAERRLGARLFERLRGNLQPTEGGAIVVAGAERIELEAQALERRVAGADQTVAGTVRVTSVPIVVNHVLLPALPALIEAHPQLHLELIAEPRDLSLTRREADLALRLARPTRETRAFARRVGRLDYAVYGLASRRPDTLPWITYEDSMSDLPQARWIADTASREAQALAQVRVSDAETLLQSVKAGLGRSLLPVAIGAQDPTLVRQDEGLIPVTRELWLMVHPELRKLARVGAVADWLTSAIAGMQDATPA